MGGQTPKVRARTLEKGPVSPCLSKHILKNLAPERPTSVPWTQALIVSGRPVWDLALCVLWLQGTASNYS